MKYDSFELLYKLKIRFKNTLQREDYLEEKF